MPDRTVPLFLLAAFVAACSTDSVNPSSGNSRVLLIDAPFPYDSVARVDIYVMSVSASLATDTSASAPAGSFSTLATPGRRINMLGLQNGVSDQLGAVTLPNGAVKAVRMVIDTDSSSITLKDGTVLTGRSSPGIQWQSSAGRPTLEALIHEQILVPDSGATIVIDFDVGKSFITPQEINAASTDRGFIFSPVLRAADGARTGSVAGIVRAHAESGAPVKDASLRLYLGTPGTPENTWSMLATAKTDASGAFKFSYVTRSSWWAAIAAQAGKKYIIAADPPRASGLGRSIVPNLSVSAGVETNAGLVVLP